MGRLLRETGDPAERLDLEITENAMLAHPDETLAILNRLNSDGMRLSIDDFGTGYSSLAYLKRLPVNEITIDKGFVTDMAEDEHDAAIVRSSIKVASELHLDVVAEGVETGDVLKQLIELGCTSAQVYYIAKPFPPPNSVDGSSLGLCVPRPRCGPIETMCEHRPAVAEPIRDRPKGKWHSGLTKDGASALVVERANSWRSNDASMRPHTDRTVRQRWVRWP